MNPAEFAMLATGGTFADNFRRTFRWEASMGSDPVDVAQAVTYGLLMLFPGAIFGVAGVVLVPATPPLGIVVFTAFPIGAAHVAGVRHRWWALGTGAGIGGVIGAAIAVVLSAVIGPDWADLVGVLAGCLAAMPVYAAVTHVPHRRRPLRDGSRAEGDNGSAL